MFRYSFKRLLPGRLQSKRGARPVSDGRTPSAASLGRRRRRCRRRCGWSAAERGAVWRSRWRSGSPAARTRLDRKGEVRVSSVDRAFLRRAGGSIDVSCGFAKANRCRFEAEWFRKGTAGDKPKSQNNKPFIRVLPGLGWTCLLFNLEKGSDSTCLYQLCLSLDQK